MTPTAEERAEAAAIDVEGRQARIAEILGKSTTGGQDAAIEDTRRRKPAVKGLCVNCGRHHSRHYTYQNESYCNKNCTVHFSLEQKAEPAAQVAGTLTASQYDEILRLDGIRTADRQAAEEVDTKAKDAWAQFNRSEAAYFNYLDSITMK